MFVMARTVECRKRDVCTVKRNEESKRGERYLERFYLGRVLNATRLHRVKGTGMRGRNDTEEWVTYMSMEMRFARRT